MRDPDRVRTQETWIAWIRVFALPWAVLEVGVLAEDDPAGYQAWAWVTTGIFALGAALLLRLAQSRLGPRARRVLGAAALAFDTALIYAYLFLYAFEPLLPVRALI